MTQVFIGAGSNIEPRTHLLAALDQLQAALGPLRVSPVYESAAAGFVGDPFLNLVIGVKTTLGVGELKALMRRIEQANGYDGRGPKFSSRTLDLDLLLYGNQVGQIDGVRLPRNDVLNCAYVLWPLADIAPEDRHPQLDISYAGLRESFAGDRGLARVAFIWRGDDLSAVDAAR